MIGRHTNPSLSPSFAPNLIMSLRLGELWIEFNGTEDLLRRLFELSQAIVNDYQRFEGFVSRNVFRGSDSRDSLRPSEARKL